MSLTSARILNRKLPLKIWKIRKIAHAVYCMHWLQKRRRTKLQHVKVWLRWRTVILTSLKEVITRDESWCFSHNSVLKQSSSVCVGGNSPWPQKLWFQKTMFAIFFTVGRESCTKNLYQMDRLLTLNSTEKWWSNIWKRHCCVRLDLAQSGNWFLMHNNAPSQIATSSNSFSQRKALLFFNTPLLTIFGTCRLHSIR
jgi:hypothetical protein